MSRVVLGSVLALMACRGRTMTQAPADAAQATAQPAARPAAQPGVDAAGDSDGFEVAGIGWNGVDAGVDGPVLASLSRADAFSLNDLPTLSPIDAIPANDGPILGAKDAAASRFLLTVDELPDTLNGSRPYRQGDQIPHEFRVRVNRTDFTLDLAASEGVDWSTLAVRCDQPVRLREGGTLAPDEPLPLALFGPGQGSFGRRVHFTWAALPDGATVTCRGAIHGPGGALESSLTFLAADLTSALDPFPRPDEWLVLLSRDLFRLEVKAQSDGTRLVSSVYVPEGNGEADFDEPLYELGLLSRQVPEAARLVKARLLGEVRRQAYRIFGLASDGQPGPDGVPLRLWFEGDPGAPRAADYGTGTFSMIALGGDGTPADQVARRVGVADFDLNNRTRNDNSGYGRGVYATAIVRQVLANSLSLLVLSAILPGRGTPIGEDPMDARILSPDFDPASADSATRSRSQVYTLVTRLLSMALASTLCHEMGHSLGLVPSGAPPRGMFAEMPGLDFTVADSEGAHIDTPGLNVEQTGATTNWTEALVEEPRLNELSLAYLRRRLVVGAP